jgi:hypothetical protein
MSEILLVTHCAPTLAGIKTGSLFNCRSLCGRNLHNEVRRLNRLLNSKGVRIKILREREERALIYVYRPKYLAADLKKDGVLVFLQSCGYRIQNVYGMVQQLVEHLRSTEQFPHEIGLFLGYPLGDVKGFIANQGSNCKCCGCWKVYTDANYAQVLFERYRRCTGVYYRKFTEGFSIQRLTVTV